MGQWSLSIIQSSQQKQTIFARLHPNSPSTESMGIKNYYFNQLNLEVFCYVEVISLIILHWMISFGGKQLYIAIHLSLWSSLEQIGKEVSSIYDTALLSLKRNFYRLSSFEGSDWTMMVSWQSCWIRLCTKVQSCPSPFCGKGPILLPHRKTSGLLTYLLLSSSKLLTRF